METETESSIAQIARQALATARSMAIVDTETKNKALLAIADRIERDQAAILAANEKDLEAGTANGLSSAMIDRLRLTPNRIGQMAEGVRQVVALPDPVGEEISRETRPNGLELRRVRVPIGVVGIIYESRPNVTIDCAVLCLKSGNAAILRGGKEAIHSNSALAEAITHALVSTGVPEHAVQLIRTTDRAALLELLKADEQVHCIIPRGGEGLIRFVAEHARMPVIKHYKGNCCIYVHSSADLEMATSIVTSAKTSRPGVCNAAETLFIDEAALQTHLPELARALIAKSVELRVNAQAGAVLDAHSIPYKPACDADYYEEYLDLILAVKTVSDVDDAISCTHQYGSGHSDAIIAADEAAAAYFLKSVDSATVYWNASTRFTDGYEFGLGAEIGISTDKLHARGPMGLRELTTYKYVIVGNGQVK